jgi:hypothetical protein
MGRRVNGRGAAAHACRIVCMRVCARKNWHLYIPSMSVLLVLMICCHVDLTCAQGACERAHATKTRPMTAHGRWYSDTPFQGLASHFSRDGASSVLVAAPARRGLLGNPKWFTREPYRDIGLKCPAARRAQLLELLLRLRGGAGGGPKTRIEGGSRKGQWLGLKRSADGGRVVLEESYEKRRKPTAAEEAAMQEQEAAAHANALEAHRAAGLIATQALKQVVDACRPGMNTSHVSVLGDEIVIELLRAHYPHRSHLLPNASSPVSERAARYSSTRMGTARERVTSKDLNPADRGLGVAHPTTVAVNNQCGRCAPLPGSPVDRQMALGDLVKIEVSVHIEGHLASAAHSFIVGHSQPLPRQVARAVCVCVCVCVCVL